MPFAPEISVLMCTHNAWPFLPEAVDSVLASKEVDLELIIVNDGSTDGSIDYLNSLKDERIKLIHQEQSGVAAAANNGFKYCSSELIARFDADDVMSPRRLKHQLDYLREHKDVGIVAGKADLMKSDFRQEGYLNYVEWSNGLITHQQMKDHRFRDSPIINPTATIRRSVFEHIGMYQTTGPEDYEFWMRAFERGVKVAKLDDMVLQWRDHDRRLTRTHNDYNEIAFLAVKIDYFTKAWDNKRPLFIWGKNRNGSRWFEELSRKEVHIDGFVDFQDGTWKELPVLSIDRALQDRDRFFIVTVRDRKGSRLIQRELERFGFTMGTDFIFT